MFTYYKLKIHYVSKSSPGVPLGFNKHNCNLSPCKTDQQVNTLF